uniref:PGG domain-containing protein n=2 Tax=Oryza nivara TaxID=4536 RepID=A0A0E0HSV9_ORYNI
MANSSIVYQQAATSVMVSHGEQLCRKANAQRNLEHGVLVTIFSSAVLMDYLVDGPPWANGGLVFTATLLLAFATFICGSALMLLGLAGRLFSGGRRVAVVSMCLVVALSALTLLGLLICAFPYVQDLTSLCRLCMPER